MWRAMDLVPMGDKVVVALPAAPFPLANAAELRIDKRDHGLISRADGYGSHGEPVRRVRKRGKVAEVWFGSGKLLREKDLGAEVKSRYRLATKSPGFEA
jgi:hypothetical protein